MSGSLRLAGTATKFFGPGQTGKFVPSDDNMVATGRYTQEEPNAVATWLGNMLKLPPAKPEPLTYTPMPGRGIEVTVTGGRMAFRAGTARSRRAINQSEATPDHGKAGCSNS